MAVRLPRDGVKPEWEYENLSLSYPSQYHEIGNPDFG